LLDTTIESQHTEITQLFFGQTLTEAAWWDDYYRPMERRLPTLRKKYHNNPAALIIIDEAQHEIDMYRANSDYYGYVFFVMQRESFHPRKPVPLDEPRLFG
jgi:hypothetical protein